jgi:hypothetical protein
LMGDFDAMHDLDEFGTDIQHSLSELLAAARAAKPTPPKRAKKKAAAAQ